MQPPLRGLNPAPGTARRTGTGNERFACGAGPDLLEHMVKLHYNWKYAFVRPTMDEIIERYNAKFKSKPDAADVDVVASAIVAGHTAS